MKSHIPIKENEETYKEALSEISPIRIESRHINLNIDDLERNKCVCINPTSNETRYYKVLRTQIQQRCKEKGWKTVMVTSPLSREGKTLTSINLAITFAKEFNRTVLLVDCDFKKQDVHRYMCYSSNRGLIDYLIDDVALKELIVRPNIDKLAIISGKRTIHDGSELLGSPKMKSLVEEMKSRYDDRYVFFDVPQILNVADTIAFAPMVDCILMVVEKGRTKISDIKKAVNLIPREKFIGFVMNRNGYMMK